MGFAVFHCDEPGKLFAQTFGVFRHHFLGKHIAGRGAAGGVPDLGRGTAHQYHRNMTGFLQKTHGHHRKQMPHMETVAGRIKSHIKSHIAGIEIFFDRRTVGFLINKSACLQFLIDVHTSACFPWLKKNSAVCRTTE